MQMLLYRVFICHWFKFYLMLDVQSHGGWRYPVNIFTVSNNEIAGNPNINENLHLLSPF